VLSNVPFNISSDYHDVTAQPRLLVSKPNLTRWFFLSLLLANAGSVFNREKVAGEALSLQNNPVFVKPGEPTPTDNGRFPLKMKYLPVTQNLIRMRKDTSQQRIALRAKHAHVGECIRRVQQYVDDIRKCIPSQSYESTQCELISNNNRLVDLQLRSRLQTYGDETCLRNCHETVVKINANIAALDEKLIEVNRMEVELAEAPIMPGDNQIRDQIREYKRIIKVAKEGNILLRTACENLKNDAEVVRIGAPVRKGIFASHCNATSMGRNVTLPDFDDNPADKSHYKLWTYLNSMRAVMEQLEVLKVQIYNRIEVTGVQVREPMFS
jgi:hypothetical protein